MTVERVRLGFAYAVGALAACLFLRGMHTASYSAILPILFCLGLTAAALSALIGKRASAGLPAFNRRNRTLGISSEAAPSGRAASTPTAYPRDRREGRQANGAALLAHEIKNYLCTLKGNALLLRQCGISDEHDNILDRIDRVVEKLEAFAKDLGASPDPMGYVEIASSMSGISLAMKAPIRRPVRLAELARSCARTHFHAHVGVFRWEVLEEGFQGDAGRLEQVFLNLYANAIEAGALKVETRVRREGGRLLVAIEDDGEGCGPDDLGRIFEPFFTTKPGSARRGLGMFIVQSIVEGHGGKIRVQSKNDPSKGSHGLIFILDLPFSEVSFLRPADPVPASAPPASAPLPDSEALVGVKRMLLALPEPF